MEEHDMAGNRNNKNRSCKYTIVPIALLLLLLVLPLTLAAGIGASPGVLYFHDMLRGGYAEKEVLISTTSAQPVELEYRAVGEIEDWIEVEVEEDKLSLGRPVKLKVSVEPDEDAQNGIYEGTVQVFLKSKQTGEGISSRVLPGVNIALNVKIVGEEILSCKLLSANIGDVETDYPLELKTLIKNTGNVNMKPQVVLDIWNHDMTELVRTETLSLERIRPTMQKTLITQEQLDLDMGQYWAELYMPECDQETLITFDVVEKGQIVDKGNLVRLLAQPGSGIVPIDAFFKNTGQRIVSAKLVGKVYSDDKIVETFETDVLDIEPNQIHRFEAYFTPEKPGSYKVEGKVLYNNKLTYSKVVDVKVEPEQMQKITGAVVGGGTGMKVLPVIIMIAILALLVLIIKKKRKVRRR